MVDLAHEPSWFFPSAPWTGASQPIPPEHAAAPWLVHLWMGGSHLIRPCFTDAEALDIAKIHMGFDDVSKVMIERRKIREP